MEEALISIILPVYNGETYVSDAIKSCLNQTYRNIELIIIDDASIDNTLNIVKTFADFDSRIKIITNTTNKKLPASLNIGHKLAKGDFITWTSDDNIYQKDAIKTMHDKLIDSRSDIVYCEYLIIDDNGIITNQSRLKPIEYLFFYGIIGACFLYKKEVFIKNEGYNENFFLVEDYDFWLRALKHSKFTKIDNPGYYLYRYHENSLTIKMKKDSELKALFLNNLNLLYDSFFDDIKIKNKEILIDYLVDRFLNGTTRSVDFIKNHYFFNDLEIASSSLIDFSFEKLKRIILNDCINEILMHKKHQTLSNLFMLHKISSDSLLRLPVKRYLALTKKCLF